MIPRLGVTFGEFFNEIRSFVCMWWTFKKCVQNDSFSMSNSLASENLSHKSLQCAKNEVHVLEDAELPSTPLPFSLEFLVAARSFART